MFSLSFKVFAGFLTLALVFRGSDASAAFKLIPPPQKAPAVEAPQAVLPPTEQVVIPAPVPMAPVQTTPLSSGSVLNAGRLMQAPQPIPLAAPVPVATPQPQLVPTAIPLPKSELLAAAKKTSGQNTLVEPAIAQKTVSNDVKGFGKNIPLHTALRQIAPQGHSFGYESGINPAQSVSWQGGQNWRDVLSASLQKQGLTYRETGSLIYIQRTTPMAARAEPASLSPPAPIAVTSAAGPMTDIPSTPVYTSAMASASPASGPMTDIPSDAMYQPAAVSSVPVATGPMTDVPSTSVQPLPPVSSNFNPPMTVAMNESADISAVIDDSDDADIEALIAREQATQLVTEEIVQPAPQSVQATPVAQPVIVAPAVETVQVVETVSVSSAVATAPIAQSRSWAALPGSTLRTTLQKWCDQVNAELTWNAEYDYPVQAPVRIDGTFDDAVRAMLKGFEKANPPPKGNIFTGQGKQAVLVITAPGNDYTN